MRFYHFIITRTHTNHNTLYIQYTVQTPTQRCARVFVYIIRYFLVNVFRIVFIFQLVLNVNGFFLPSSFTCPIFPCTHVRTHALTHRIEHMLLSLSSFHSVYQTQTKIVIKQLKEEKTKQPSGIKRSNLHLRLPLRHTVKVKIQSKWIIPLCILCH